MCLAIPGRVVDISGESPLQREGRVNFDGVLRSVNLTLVPEAAVGVYVLVHAGIAIGILDRVEAERTLAQLQSLDTQAEDSQ
jgi:hydrogenase expression/formation protein HypC